MPMFNKVAVAPLLGVALALSFATTSRADDAAPAVASPSVETPAVTAPVVESTYVAPTYVAPAYVPPTEPLEATTRRPNRTLLWAGIVVFSVTYTGSVVAGGAAGDRVEDKNLFIPLVGPWLDLGQRNCEFRRCDDGQEAIWKSLIVASGILQGAGALLTLSSFFVPETTHTRRVGGVAPRPPGPELHIAPVSYAAGGGIGAVGRF